MKYELIPIYKIDSMEVKNEIVYDIEVEDDHSYCVDDNIIVHNSACTTKNCTGIYQGMISLLMECVTSGAGVNIIADGGINSPARYCKALAFGANAVILGAALAACVDSPSQSVYNDDVLHKMYNGSASFNNQLLYKTTPRYIEGKTVMLPCMGDIETLFTGFQEGLRSSMSYFGARNLTEYRDKINWSLVK